MLHKEKLRLGEVKCVEVTELQVERESWTQVSLTPELKGSSSTICLVFAEALGSGARGAKGGEFPFPLPWGPRQTGR